METATNAAELSPTVAGVLGAAIELYRIVDAENTGPFNLHAFAEELPSLIKATQVETKYSAGDSDHYINFSQNDHYINLDKTLYNGSESTSEDEDFEIVLDFFNVGLDRLIRFTDAYPEFASFITSYANTPVASSSEAINAIVRELGDAFNSMVFVPMDPSEISDFKLPDGIVNYSETNLPNPEFEVSSIMDQLADLIATDYIVAPTGEYDSFSIVL